MQAAQLYERAIELDPHFVLAFANLSIAAQLDLSQLRADRCRSAILAKRFADRALRARARIRPKRISRAVIRSTTARTTTRAPCASLPSPSAVCLTTPRLISSSARFNAGRANGRNRPTNLEKAVSLNPNDTWPLQNLFFNYQMTAQFRGGESGCGSRLGDQSASFNFWGFKAKLAFAERGDLTVAETSLAQLDQEMASGQLKNLDPEMRAEVALGKGNLLLLVANTKRRRNTPPGPAASFRRPSSPAWSRPPSRRHRLPKARPDSGGAVHFHASERRG